MINQIKRCQGWTILEVMEWNKIEKWISKMKRKECKEIIWGEISEKVLSQLQNEGCIVEPKGSGDNWHNVIRFK